MNSVFESISVILLKGYHRRQMSEREKGISLNDD